MKIPASELIINSDGSVFHLHIRPEQLADKVILVGDPGRVNMFRPMFEEIECENASREFVWITGLHNGSRITVLSTGIGTDNIDIVMTELDALANVDFQTREVKPEHKALDILRIGTCGCIQKDIPLGAFILSHISIGCDGLLNWYSDRDKVSLLDFEEHFKSHMDWNRHLPDPYFAKASDRIINAFADKTVKGMTISASGFYGPQGRVVRLPLAMPDMIENFISFEHGGYKITNIEMEGSAIAGLAAHLGHNAATVCCAIAHRYLKAANTDYKPRVEELCRLCLDTLASLD